MENIFFSGSDTKLNQRLYLGKKGLDGHLSGHTQLAEIITGRVQVEVPIFIGLISDGNKSDFLMFLNSVTGKQSQYYLCRSTNPPDNDMCCWSNTPHCFLAAPNFEQISHKFFSDPNQDLQSIGYRRPIFQINFV